MSQYDKDLTIVVSGISPLLEINHLKELFECCGPIRSCEMRVDSDGSKAAYITYKEASHAKAAVFLSGTPLGGSNLVVSSYTPAPAPAPAPMTPPPAVYSPAPVAFSSAPLYPTPAAADADAAVAALAAAQGNIPMPLLQASMKRADEVARTVYVGNLNATTTEQDLAAFFSTCGEVSFVKLAGSVDITQVTRYAFVEFKEQASAIVAMSLSGATLGDRVIKVGKANNPIVKPPSEQPTAVEADQRKIDKAMEKVRQAQALIAKKTLGESKESKDDDKEKRKDRKDRHRSRSRSRSRGRRSSRKSRSRSRSRGSSRRSSRRSRSRSRSRGSSRRSDRRSRRSPSPKRPPRKQKMDTTGLYWDGFQWNPIVPGLVPAGTDPIGKR